MLSYHQICTLINEYLCFKNHIQGCSEWKRKKQENYGSQFDWKSEIKLESSDYKINSSNISLNEFTQNIWIENQLQVCKYSYLDFSSVYVDSHSSDGTNCKWFLFNPYSWWLFSMEHNKIINAQKQISTRAFNNVLQLFSTVSIP